MKNSIRFSHTNIIACDWKKLARFYIDVFGYEPVYPERDLSGDWIDRLTRINNVHIKGVHLRLPGHSDGPTLEIFSYSEPEPGPERPLINRVGFGHIAFHVDDVEEVFNKLLSHGGSAYGELVQTEMNNLGTLTVIYAIDLEGNIIEIQNWKKSK